VGRRLPALNPNQKQNMSDNENEQIAFRNADTLHRRAWIDRALSGVRGRLQPDGEGDPLQLAPPPPVTGAPSAKPAPIYTWCATATTAEAGAVSLPAP
jgi:hypothetical protein